MYSPSAEEYDEEIKSSTKSQTSCRFCNKQNESNHSDSDLYSHSISDVKSNSDSDFDLKLTKKEEKEEEEEEEEDKSPFISKYENQNRIKKKNKEKEHHHHHPVSKHKRCDNDEDNNDNNDDDNNLEKKIESKTNIKCLTKYPCLSKIVSEVKFGVVTIFVQGLTNQQSITATSSGWLYRYKHDFYVITCAHGVIQTNITSPFSKITCAIAGLNKNPLDVKIFNLEILGIDATADVVVLKFKKKDSHELKKLKPSITLLFADSNLEKEGNLCFTIGNPLNTDVLSVSSGVIRDPQFAGTRGNHIVELMITDLSIFTGTSGSPIFNAFGFVIGIIAFEFTSTGVTSSPGYGGGTSSGMLLPIIHNIIKGRRLTPVPIVQQSLYPIINLKNCYQDHYIFTYRKGNYGDITWVLMTNGNAVSFYPHNYKNLNVQGLIITGFTSPNNVFQKQKPLSGKPVLVGDIITDIKDKKGRWVPIGAYDRMFSAGRVLWQFDPNKKPIVEHKVIHHPNTNTQKEIVQIQLDINYPRTETSPLTSGQLLFGIGTDHLLTVPPFF